MKSGYDVIVIGGAVMGSSVAFWLTRLADRPLRILVVEKDRSYARSSTALSVASIRQQFTNPVNVEISRFGVDFIRNFKENIGLGRDVHSLGLRENGYLFLTCSPQGASVMRDAAEMQCAHGAGTVLMDPDALAQRFAWLSVEDVVLGSFGTRDEGWFDNMGLMQGFRAAARAGGVENIDDTVTGVTTHSGRVTGVTLAHGGTVSAGVVVNAAGPNAADILRMVGEELPVEPRKRTVFMVEAPNARHADAPLMVDPSGFYMRPEHGCWICAIVPDHDAAVAPDDFEPDHSAFEDIIWPLIYHRVPGFDEARVRSMWVGHYAYNTLDQNAILGPHPNFPNLFLMNGFSGHGLQQAPAVGRGLAEIILTGAYQTLDLSDLGVERILAGKPFLEVAIV
ncbi:NAD(P)/FAD-dependent oxidoreductase [Pseudogemmobacter sp. W21_MBD1_M6]|uniref:NAD(P)/FAD-dependent oxidoreductase n=1 Tax=Pseudogemmobacter sp. W21_MBD1_M6 TaxID=3240271 RepID=UPI003F98774E